VTTDDGGAGAWSAPRHYLRTGGGQVVHRAGCFAALGGTPWEWAEGMTAAELAGEPPPALPLLDRVRLAYEHMTRAVDLDLDKAKWLSAKGELLDDSRGDPGRP
jgi:hypothetical protein